MAYITQDFATDYPEYARKMSALRAAEANVAQMVADYNRLKQTVALAQAERSGAEDEDKAELRRLRVALKDAIYTALRA